MTALKSLQQTFSISLEGMREAILAIAERVASRVQVGKLQLQTEDIETRLRNTYAALGQCLYRTRLSPHQGVFPADDVLQLCNRIRMEQKTLHDVRDRLASQYDELLDASLHRLKEDLRDGRGTIERVTITTAARADGKSLGRLALPAAVQFILVRRGETVIFPSSDTVLKAGDQVTVVGSRSGVSSTLDVFRS